MMLSALLYIHKLFHMIYRITTNTGLKNEVTNTSQTNLRTRKNPVYFEICRLFVLRSFVQVQELHAKSKTAD